MAQCTDCGTILHEDDLHKCDPSKIPAKGEMIKKGETAKVPNPESDLNK